MRHNESDENIKLNDERRWRQIFFFTFFRYLNDTNKINVNGATRYCI